MNDFKIKCLVCNNFCKQKCFLNNKIYNSYVKNKSLFSILIDGHSYPVYRGYTYDLIYYDDANFFKSV